MLQNGETAGIWNGGTPSSMQDLPTPTRRSSSPKHPALRNIDPATRFLYTPKTVTALLIGLGTVVYLSRAFNPSPHPTDELEAARSSNRNAKFGLAAAALSYLCYSTVQGPSSPLVRPHPAVWRLIHGIIVLYLVSLIFLLFQDAHDARLFLKELFPSLGVDPGERAYGAECRLYIPGKGINWETIKATVFDEFVVAHTLGWWAKALILRNSVLLWSLSILFEFMELTFQHMLPNFNECWWDSWILDVAVCNNVGIITGLWTVRYFGSKTYNWRGISEQPTYADKAKRSLMQFLPYSLDSFEWRIFSSPARFIECLVPVLIFLLFELHAFFLKFVLWIPPLNPLNTIRLLILLGMGLPATRQYYNFIECENLSLNKIGAFAWLGLALAIVETLVAVKFGHGMYPNPWPHRTIAVWSVVGMVFTVTFSAWCVKFYVLDKHRFTQNTRAERLKEQ